MGEPMPGEGQEAGEGTPKDPMPGKPNPMAKKAGSRQSGEPTENEKQTPGKLEIAEAPHGEGKGEADKQDSDATKQKYKEEPWFAKLPPSLRTAIGAKSRNKAPRGYEERLKRYFESID
jgi:hypothetical protein